MRTSILEKPVTFETATKTEAALPYAVEVAAATVVNAALNELLPPAEARQTGNADEPAFQSITPVRPNLPA